MEIRQWFCTLHDGNQRGCATIHGTKMIQPKVQYWEQQAPGQCRLPLNSTRTAGRRARHEAIPCLGATLGFVGPLPMEGPATAVAVNTLKPCSRIREDVRAVVCGLTAGCRTMGWSIRRTVAILLRAGVVGTTQGLEGVGGAFHIQISMRMRNTAPCPPPVHRTSG